MFNTATSREALGSSRKLADEPHSAPGTYCCFLHATCSSWEQLTLQDRAGVRQGRQRTRVHPCEADNQAHFISRSTQRRCSFAST